MIQKLEFAQLSTVTGGKKHKGWLECGFIAMGCKGSPKSSSCKEWKKYCQ